MAAIRYRPRAAASGMLPYGQPRSMGGMTSGCAAHETAPTNTKPSRPAAFGCRVIGVSLNTIETWGIPH